MRIWPKVRRAVILAVFLAIAILAVPLLMRVIVASEIYTAPESAPQKDIAIVLGASVVKGEPSPVLAARADVAAQLYLNQKVKKILVTGDSSSPSHDEVTPVRTYLVDAGVRPEDIVLDEAGVDTYSSMHRAQAVFGVASATIVTQDFHMPRALFIARFLGIDAAGALAREGDDALYAYLREIPASWKALFDLIAMRQPKHFGPEILPSG